MSDCKSLNLYGLAYGALMTGEGVENILAYCLSMFFRRWVEKYKNDKKKLELFEKIIRSKPHLNIDIDTSIMVDTISRMAHEVEKCYERYDREAHP